MLAASLPSRAMAQPAKPPIPVDSFVRLSGDESISNADVRTIVQDKDGFMWFGMRVGGLVRYDGYEAKIYEYKGHDIRTLSDPVVLTLLVDGLGTLWVGTEGGLNRYDRNTDSFVRYRHDPARLDSLPNDTITCLLEDSQGTLWVGTRNGLCRMNDRQRGTFTTYRRPAVLAGTASTDTYRSIFEDVSTGLLWLGASDGLAAFDPRTGAFASFIHDPADSGSVRGNAVNEVLRGPDGVFWALTENGVDSFSPAFTAVPKHTVQVPRITFRHLRQPLDPGNARASYVRDGLFDAHGRLWLATRGGLQLLDPETRTFTSYRNRPDDWTSLSDDVVHTLCRDNAGNLWIGTYTGGVCRMRSEAKQFRVERHIPSDPRSISDSRIGGVAFDPAGRLWLATSRGLSRRDAEGWTSFLHDPADPASLPSNDISTLAAAPGGEVWLGMHNTGVIRFDGTRFHRIPSAANPLPVPSGIHPFTGRQVNSILADGTGGVWLGARAYGLDYLSNGQVHHYAPGITPDSGHPTNSAVFGVLDEDDVVWFATTGAIVRFDPTTKKFTRFEVQIEGHSRSVGRNLHCLTRGNDGLLWIGSTDGLLKFDPRTGRFPGHYTTADGLPNNSVMTIVADTRGHLWLGTANGLVDFDPQSEKARAYSRSDGLPSGVFSQRAGALGPDGRVYMGTRSGLVSFLPEELRENPTPPPVAITEIRWLGEERSGDAATAAQPQWPAGDTLHVAAGQPGFSIKFAALDFTAPESNRYRYRLEGWDAGWTDATAVERTATYTALPPGHYTFRVQASNPDGVWNTKGATLPIVIAPHLWQRTEFRVAAILALACAIGLGLHFRMRSIRGANRLLEQQVAQRTSELQSEIAVRQKAESALRESHDQLEVRVRERTVELATTNANLEAEIAERRKVEAQLRHSQKMEAIGQLAGGIAHDFNNLLTVILGQTELLSLSDNTNGRAAAVRDIKTAAQRAAKLTRQLLIFSRREPMRLAVVDLNAVVSGDVEMLRRVIGEDVILKTSFAAGTLPVQADASMVEQLLLNLTLNARDAMPDGGQLTISTDAATLTTAQPEHGPHALTGRYARIVVRDTGTGIAPDVLARVYEPFFTTKDRGKGTGLGLPICQGILHQHRGWLDVDTQVGKGTTFRAWLPLQPAAITSATGHTPLPPRARLGATVLVVEDEMEVRSVATRVLTHHGYRVIEASCGAEALERWSTYGSHIDVLLTDIVMPGHPNGHELAECLRREKQTLHIITMSGYDPAAAARGATPAPYARHLRKPFTVTDLLSAVAETPRRADA